MLKQPGITAAALTAFIGSILVTALWFWNFPGPELSHDSLKWAEFGSYIGGTLGPILAFASFVGLLVTIQHQATVQTNNEARADSEVYRVNATKNLERAYRAFMGNSDSPVPISDRLVWLTVARLILSAKLISKRIKVESIRTMYNEDEEYWRQRFYDVLDPIDVTSPLNNSDYFREGEKKVSGYNIDERSIRVIYGFIEWPENQSDPMDDFEGYTEEEISNMGASRYGVKTYLQYLRSGTKPCHPTTI